MIWLTFKRVAYASTLTIAMASGAFSADFEFSEESTGGALVKLWGQGVFPTHAIEDGDDCNSGGEEFCVDVFGFGGYAAGMTVMDNGWALMGDATFDYHEETHSDSGDQDDPAVYAGFGLHFYDANQEDPWGIFGMVLAGENHADSDSSGIGLGLGLEKAFGDMWVQGGVVGNLDDDADTDTYKHFYFAGIGGAWAMGNGSLSASAMLAQGEKNEGGLDAGTMNFAQLALTYAAPLGDTGMNWFAGVQSDYFQEDDDASEDRAWMNAVKLGVSIPVGGGTGPFRTPNLRSPVTYAGEI